jgi:hypothetical protein
MNRDLQQAPAGELFLRNDGQGLHFEKEVRMRKPCDKEDRDDRRILQLPEHLLKGTHRRTCRLPLEEIDRPLDDMLYSRIGGGQRDAKIVGHLFRL